jgi:FkbM family methyltransferase
LRRPTPTGIAAERVDLSIGGGAMHATRQLLFGGREYEVCGRAEDPYFTGISPDDESHAFLRWVCTNSLKQDAVILDVGANIGITAIMFAATAPNGRVCCFEPSPSVYPCLLETIARNGLENCRAMPVALAAAAGAGSFFDNPTSASASHLFSQRQTLGDKSHIVDISTVDAFLAAEKIDRLDLIKIDVEGFEPEVLAGAGIALSTLQPSVFLEFNSFTLIAYGDRNPRRFLEELIDTFPYVYRFEQNAVHQISTSHDVLDFIHDNLVRHGCVDDLFCSVEAV